MLQSHYVASLLTVFAAKPDHVVLWWRDRPISAAEFSRSITTAAAVLQSKGIGDTSTVALLISGNSPELLVARYAANLLGATVLHAQSLNAANALDEMPVGTQAEILAESRATLLVVDSHNVERARAIAARMSPAPTLATFGRHGPEVVDLSSAPATTEQSPAEIAPTSGRIAVVIYTSGSTGRPKGVGYSFATVNAAYFVRTSASMSRPPSSPANELDPQVQQLLKIWNAETAHVRLVTTPVGQMAAFSVDVSLGIGGTVMLHDGFEPDQVLATVAKHRVTHLYTTPPQLYELVDHPARAATDLASLRLLVYAGCPAAPTRLAQAVEAFGPILCQAYGLTETTGITTLLPADHLNPKLLATVGRPLPMVEIAIRDPHRAEDIPIGQTGEICVRTPMMMDGYWCAAELTKQKVRDGWLHTGDLGFLDDDGYLHLVDRIAGMIKTGGIKVYPSTVESALLAHPAVAQAAVYGVMDAEKREHVHAAVVPRHGMTVDPDEIRDYVKSTLPHAHVPVGITVLSELPLTTTGKPDKRHLRFAFERNAGWRR